MMIIPLVLSAGTCLRPLPRAGRPDEVVAFSPSRSLLQEAALRCHSAVFDPLPIVVGAEEHRPAIVEQLGDIEVTADIILQPVDRGSCAAIAAGCLQAVRRDPAAVVLVHAADHFIPDTASFGAAIQEGLWDAELGFLVAFGIRPDRPGTGHGYIALGPELFGAGYGVRRFIATPDAETAERCVSEGCLRSTGNFLFEAATFLLDLKRLAPEILEPVRKAFEGARFDAPFLRLDGHALAAAPALSVEQAVMEKTARAAVLPVESAGFELRGLSPVTAPSPGTPGESFAEIIQAIDGGTAAETAAQAVAERTPEARQLDLAESQLK